MAEDPLRRSKLASAEDGALGPPKDPAMSLSTGVLPAGAAHPHQLASDDSTPRALGDLVAQKKQRRREASSHNAKLGHEGAGLAGPGLTGGSVPAAPQAQPGSEIELFSCCLSEQHLGEARKQGVRLRLNESCQ